MKKGYASGRDISRTDPMMVQVVRELGERANNNFSRILLEDIPAKFIDHYTIEDYDGMESVRIEYEKHALQRIQDIANDSALSPEEKIKQTQCVLVENQAYHAE